MKKRLILLGIICVLLISLAVSASAASGDFQITLEPKSGGTAITEASLGSSFTVDAKVTANSSNGVSVVEFTPSISGNNGVKLESIEKIADWAPSSDVEADKSVAYTSISGNNTKNNVSIVRMTFSVASDASLNPVTIALTFGDVGYDDANEDFVDVTAGCDPVTINIIDKACDHANKANGRVARVEATCGKAGNIEYFHCPDCGQDVDASGNTLKPADITIAALKHQFETRPGQAATCAENGWEESYYCTVCKKLYDEESEDISQDMAISVANVIYKEDMPHTYGTLQSKVATCTETGELAHYFCSVCETYFDQDYNEIDEDDIELEMVAHTWDQSAAHEMEKATVDGSGKVEDPGVKPYKFCTACRLYYAADATDTVASNDSIAELISELYFDPDVRQAEPKELQKSDAAAAGIAAYVDEKGLKNVKIYDLELEVSYENDGKGEQDHYINYKPWADGDYMPEEGVEMVIPFTDYNASYTYVLLHDKGTTEPEVIELTGKYDAAKGGFVVEDDSASPFAVAWNVPVSPANNKGGKAGAPGTGDGTNIALWIVLFGVFAAATGTVVVLKKKAHN